MQMTAPTRCLTLTMVWIASSAIATTAALGAEVPAAALPPIDKASWIWGNMKDDVCHFCTSFTLEEAPRAATKATVATAAQMALPVPAPSRGSSGGRRSISAAAAPTP